MCVIDQIKKKWMYEGFSLKIENEKRQCAVSFVNDFMKQFF